MRRTRVSVSRTILDRLKHFDFHSATAFAPVVDSGTGNLLKRTELALSGKLMRTTYYPEWKSIYSATKKADVYVPMQIRIFDEVEKGNSTTVVMRKVELDPLDDSYFTKAWLEARSR